MSLVLFFLPAACTHTTCCTHAKGTGQFSFWTPCFQKPKYKYKNTLYMLLFKETRRK